MVTMWEVLGMARVPTTASFIMHGLRRRTVQACAARGVNLSAIMMQGTWKSDAVFNYVLTTGFIFWLSVEVLFTGLLGT